MLRRALLIAILAASVSAAAKPEIERLAVCGRGSSYVFISPGVQISPTTGSATSIDPSTGTTTATFSDCVGSIEGRPLNPARAGSFTFRAMYGMGRLSDAIGYTCLGGSGEGRISFAFPLKNGRTLRLHGSLAWNRVSGILVAGGALGHSSTWSAPMLFKPVEGDCFTTPLTVGRMTGAIVVSSNDARSNRD